MSQDLNDKVMNALIDFVKQMGTVGQAISAEFGLNGSDGMALFKIDEPVSMKELSQRLGCDASFVTAVADSLERHGLAKREPSLRDRRSKNIVLTEHGAAIRDQITPKSRPRCRGVTRSTPASASVFSDTCGRCPRRGVSCHTRGGCVVIADVSNARRPPRGRTR